MTPLMIAAFDCRLDCSLGPADGRERKRRAARSFVITFARIAAWPLT
jgi:hypothetical protein